MFNTLTSNVWQFLRDLFDFVRITNDLIFTIGYISLGLTFITSLVLIYIMVRFKNKRPVDNAVLLREIAFALVIARVFLGLVFQASFGLWAMLIYVYLAGVVGALLWLTVKEHFFTPWVIRHRYSKNKELAQEGE